MKSKRLHAVLTGDIVGSSRHSSEGRGSILQGLKSALSRIDHHWPGILTSRFDIYRGDAFQGVLGQPELALPVAIWIRSQLRYLNVDTTGWEGTPIAVDARVAVGIGTIDSAPSASEGQGEAFLRSGRTLEEMTGEERILIKTPWREVDEELETETALLEAIMQRWTPRQAEVVGGLIVGPDRTQRIVADELGISQSAVAQHARQAKWWAVQRLCLRFQGIIGLKLGPARPERGLQGV